MLINFNTVFSRTGEIIRNNALMLVCALVAAVAMMCLLYNSALPEAQNYLFIKFAIIGVLGISVSFAARLISQRSGRPVFFQLLVVIFLIGFYFRLPFREKDCTEVYAYLLIPTFILSHLLVSFIAFLQRGDEINFWQFNKNLFINIVLTGIFTGVLTGGVQLAILAVDQLFDLNLPHYWYGYTLYFFGIFGSVFIFLLFNEDGLPYLERNGEYPVILRFFSQYILIPLLLIYVLILYFYCIKILINWELPRGWVSYLILAYSVVGILAILLIYPLKTETEKPWIKIFSRIFYFTLIPLIVLLFVAIFTRILEYGYTEPRYFVLILAVWLTTVVFYFLFFPKSTIKFIPLSLFVFGFLALTLPYFNAFSTAKRWQKNKLTHILTEDKILKDGKIDFTKKISSDEADEIADKFEFLAKRKEVDFLRAFLNDEDQLILKKTVANGDFYDVKSNLRNKFKNVYLSKAATAPEAAAPNTILDSGNLKTDISGYQYLFKALNYKHNIFQFDDNTLELDLPGTPLKESLYLVLNDKKINILPDLEKLFSSQLPNRKNNTEQLYIEKKMGNYTVKILFDSLSKNPTPSGKQLININSESLIILVKKEK
jgi:hypothetical protein